MPVYDDLEDGDEQEYYVSDPNRTWEFLLENENTIKTIFLFLKNGYEQYDTLSYLTKREEIFSKYGKPSKMGDKQEISILGKKGAWERYDYPNYSFHIEHSVGSDTIEKITLMLARITS